MRFCPRACVGSNSAVTIASIALPREPFTSTRSTRAGRHGLQVAAQGIDQRGMRVEMRAPSPNARAAAALSGPKRVQARDAGGLGAPAGIGVQRFAFGTEFAHVAQHQPGFAAALAASVSMAAASEPGLAL